MCNLYSITKGQAAIREFAKAVSDTTGNLPSMPAVFPDTSAPIVRNGDGGGRELVLARWGMPSPKFVTKDRKTDPGVPNIRNTKSAHWRRWLGVEHRCLVPLTSFSEYETTEDGKKSPVWFAANDDRPLMAFAGLWTNWTSVRKVKEGEINADLFGFLTTEANAIVKPVHPKAMPVILRSEKEMDVWLNADWSEAAELQRPLPDDALTIVARGSRHDGSDET
ncbi:SOS response-associated peptidase [Fulvimarina sp. MAC3]|uniref:SOS response-associated peptidase n=1 Tax=Fulvimarina sp. MAC3 TaxID=3148887 RepID=UPI0031FC937B